MSDETRQLLLDCLEFLTREHFLGASDLKERIEKAIK